MANTPVTFNQFGGLRLDIDPVDVGGAAATGMTNVDLTRPGQISTRQGTTVVSTGAGTDLMYGMSYYRDLSGVEWMIVNDPTAANATPIKLADGSAGTVTTAISPVSNDSFARFGDTTHSRLYAVGTGVLQRYDGAWTTIVPTVTKPYLVLVTPRDNRLLLACGTTAGGIRPSTLEWSDAGAPETFSGNTLNLTPGDGEYITALIRFRDRYFVFKQTKFFVFGDESISSTGTPTFNYYTVDVGRGAQEAATMACAGDEGVYFADAAGVYVTTGGEPRCISRAIEPWILSGASGSLPGIALGTGWCAHLAYFNRRLYVSCPGTNGNFSTTSPMLVYDPALDSWSVWQGSTVGVGVVPSFSTFRGLYFGEFTSKKLWKFNPTATTDNGTTISWSWTSGKYPLGEPGEVAVTRESRLFGTGTATLTLSSDRYADQSGSVTLGTAPTPATGWLQKDQEARYFQHTLSGSGTATVESLTHNVAGIRAPEAE